MRAVIYGRFSSDQQREESLDAQVRFCEEYASSKGYVITKVYGDKALSGKNDRRPEFQKMMRDSEKGLFDVVLVHKYNRFARNMKDHVNYESRLNDANVQLIAVAEDFGQGKESIIMKSLMRALSEYYIKDLSDEVRKGMRENAYNAIHNGGCPPFGYDVVDKRYVINETEAMYVRKMFDLAVNQQKFSSLVDEMGKAGIKGKRGKPVKYTSIHEILRNEKYTGTYVYALVSQQKNRRAKENAIRIDDAIPPIIDRETWEKVQDIMTKRKIAGVESEQPNMLKGLVYCGNCGAKMHLSYSKKVSKRYFQCNKNCGVGYISMDMVEEKATDYVKELLSDEKIIEVYNSLDGYVRYQNKVALDHNKIMEKEIKKRQDQIDTYIEKLGMDLPSEIIKDISDKIMAIKGEIESLKQEEPPRMYSKEQIVNWLEHIKEAPDDKVMKILISKVTVDKEKLSIESTLNKRNLGCGEPLPIYPLPRILFEYLSAMQ